MWKVYLRGLEPTAEDYAVPMLREDFEGLPKAFVEVAEMDALADQGLAYAQKMREDGVDVKLRIIGGAYHGYDGDVSNPFVQAMIKARIEWLAEALSAVED